MLRGELMKQYNIAVVGTTGLKDKSPQFLRFHLPTLPASLAGYGLCVMGYVSHNQLILLDNIS